MIQSVETTIGGVDYQYTPMMTDPAREWLDRLIKAFGPSVASFIEGLQKSEKLSIDIDQTDELDLIRMMSGSVAGGIREFTQAISPSLHKELADKFLAQVKYRGEDGGWLLLNKDRRQILFATSLMTETKLLGWCLKEQYADFFAPLRQALVSAAARMVAKNAQHSGSQTGVIGSSGVSSPANE